MPDHNAYQQAVSDRFGLMPNCFRPAPETAALAEGLWQFAKEIYLDNPVPSLFKERLFVYLSRFCEVRYCVTRHCGFFMGLGHSSGDPLAPVETVAQAIKLLTRPTPWQRYCGQTGAARDHPVGRAAPIPEPQNLSRTAHRHPLRRHWLPLRIPTERQPMQSPVERSPPTQWPTSNQE